ncbi:MAG: translational GTPase TypA [Clostridia bacterium]|nr:MAG: translational GTPase TypA [Clostridia bacterium]
MAEQFRNIAIIAHVDHGKTTLVDGLLRQSGVFRANQEVAERVLDSNDLERERGITILAKNTAVFYAGVKINIVDTPGHADFGGEVERALSMVDGALLLVDAFEGPMPQTRFVLRKALQLGLNPIVVVNKIDRPDARPDEVLNEVFDLFVELGANERQLDFPVVYTSAKQGLANLVGDMSGHDLKPLFDTILAHVPAPDVNPGQPFQLLVANLEYDSYLGRYAVGRINRGTIKPGEQVLVLKKDGSAEPAKVAKVFVFEGLQKREVDLATAGEIVSLAGITGVNIGETVASPQAPEALPAVVVDEPTLSMYFMVNNGPFAGQEGVYVTSRKLRERLYREVDANVSLRVEDTDSPDAFKVSGRGELHLAILIENLRREGYELMVSKPEVICKTVGGRLMEPVELLIVATPEETAGAVIANLGQRQGEMLNMTAIGANEVRLEFLVPARGLIGFKSELMTNTRGRGVMSHNFYDYLPYKGEIKGRLQGSLVAWEEGLANAYGMHQLEDRGTLFIVPGTRVYAGMVVGQHTRENDLEVNVCKRKHLTNMRASGSDESLRLKEPRILSLEEAIEFIAEDELVEVTPKSIRIRKKILDRAERMRTSRHLAK